MVPMQGENFISLLMPRVPDRISRGAVIGALLPLLLPLALVAAAFCILKKA